MIFTNLLLLGLVAAHGAGKEKPAGMSWQNWHMVEEHQLDQYDSDTFFKLHDVKNKGYWDSQDVLYIYGLTRESIVGDGSGMGDHAHGQEIITADAKKHVTDVILQLIDTNGDGTISLDEWRLFMQTGKDLPDFGYGRGHHLDFESEYEEHHWKKYHANDDPDVHIKHAEDIEHELLHHEHEIEETHNKQPDIREITKNFLSEIRLDNLPSKYKW